MSEATATTPLAGTDVEAESAPAFDTNWRESDEGKASDIRERIDGLVKRLKSAQTTLRKAYSDIGQSFAEYRAVIVRANGEPDWSGESDRYKLIVSGVLDTLVDGLTPEDKRRERQTIQQAIAYHTRKAVRSMIVATVQAENPDLDAEALSKAQEKALARIERPTQTRKPKAPDLSKLSPEELEKLETSNSAKVVRQLEAISDMPAVAQAEASLRAVSALFDTVTEQAAKGIVGRDRVQDYTDRALIVLQAAGKVVAGKATESDTKAAQAAHIGAAADAS